MKPLPLSNTYRVTRVGSYPFPTTYLEDVISSSPTLIDNPVSGSNPRRIAHKAEELSSAFPEVVINRGSGTEFVDLEQMNALAWAVLGHFFDNDWKDLLNRVKVLETKVATLETKVQILETKVNSLETWKNNTTLWVSSIEAQVNTNTNAISNLK